MLYVILFLYAGVTVIFTIFLSWVVPNYTLPNYILSIVILALLPLFRIFIVWLLNDKLDSEKNIRKYNLTHIVATFLLIALLISLSWKVTSIFLATLFFLVILRGIDERVLFAYSLTTLIGTILFILMGNRSLAELFSVQTYYAFILGLIALLVAKKTSEFLDRELPYLPYPKWWDAYIIELQSLNIIMKKYLPFFIVGILCIGFSTFSSKINFDDQFLASLTLFLGFGFFTPSEEEYLYSIKNILLVILTSMTLMMMFSFHWIEGFLVVIFFLFLLYQYTFRKENLIGYYTRIHRYLFKE